MKLLKEKKNPHKTFKYKLMKNETAAPGALDDSCRSGKCHLTHLCILLCTVNAESLTGSSLQLFCFTDVD